MRFHLTTPAPGSSVHGAMLPSPHIPLFGEELLEHPVVAHAAEEDFDHLRFDQVERARAEIESGAYTTPERIAALINRLVG